ncbi:MAG TPA: Fe-S cluster assembly protein HesB [Streptosporangiaceae bacterium]|jgi:Fe-S cluster assembly iron-binding protein IscA
MLMLTETAAEVVKAITSIPQAPEGAGLRIESAVPQPADSAALQLSTAVGPAENDQVVEAAGARLYLEPEAAAYLDDKVLDAELDQEGQAHFSLAVQEPGQA